MTTTDITCPKCGATFSAPVYNSINLSEMPEMKSQLLSGELFLAECPQCGFKRLLKYPMVVLDPDSGMILCLSSSDLKVDELPAGYSLGRQVREAGELIEKLKIFDAGLDDIVMEMCKFVTLQELGKDVGLKFYRIDGADSEITFTYPENGRMEMLSVGFNVYEDCASILRRNPGLEDSVSGLARIDRSWLAMHLG